MWTPKEFERVKRRYEATAITRMEVDTPHTTTPVRMASWPSSKPFEKPQPATEEVRAFRHVDAQTEVSGEIQSSPARTSSSSGVATTSNSEHLPRNGAPPASGIVRTSQHMHLPYIIMGYLQLTFNAFVVGFMMYLAIQFLFTIQNDVDIKVDLHSQDIMKEILLCSKNYADNRCTPPDRIPAMEELCMQWEKCMNRDPKVVGRAKISAETFAGIVNSFIEPISYKTMIFFAIFLFGFLFASNFAFHFARTRYPDPSASGVAHLPPSTSSSAMAHSHQFAMGSLHGHPSLQHPSLTGEQQHLSDRWSHMSLSTPTKYS
eukprot:Opistho-2@83813